MNESNLEVCKVVHITLLYLFSDYEAVFYFHLIAIFHHNIFVDKEKYHGLYWFHYFNSNRFYYYIIFLMNILTNSNNAI